MKTIFDERHYNVKEVAEILSISTTSIHNYIKTGALRAVKIGGLWHIKESAIKDYLNGNTNAENRRER